MVQKVYRELAIAGKQKRDIQGFKSEDARRVRLEDVGLVRPTEGEASGRMKGDDVNMG